MDDFTSKQKINVRDVRSGDNEGRCAQARRGSLLSAENIENGTTRASPFIDSTGLVYNAITHRSENLDVLNRENGRLLFVSEEDLVTPTSNKGGNGRRPSRNHSSSVHYEYKFDWLTFTLPMVDKDFIKLSVLVDIGERIKKERKAMGLSLKDLANRANLSFFFLRKIERGQTCASVVVLSFIARALDKPYRYFIPANWLKGLHTSVLERLGDYVTLTDIPLPNVKGYDSTYQMFPAGRAAWHSEHPENKFLVQFSGQDLDILREYGVDIVEMMRWFSSVDAKCTRADLAIDAFNVGCVDDFIEQWDTRLEYLDKYDKYERGDVPLDERGLVTPALSSQIFIESSTKGSSKTFYLGSQHSERRLRVYNKLYEMQSKVARIDTSTGEIPPLIPEGITSWVRVELTLRKSYAENAALALHAVGDVQLFIARLVSDYCEAPSIGWYQAALSDIADIVVEPVRRKLRNTELWLLTQVLPSVKRLAKMGSQSVITLADTALNEFFASPYVHVIAGEDKGLIRGSTYFVEVGAT